MIITGDPALLLSLTNDERARLREGRAIARGDKIYSVCRRCHKLIRANKMFIGDTHLCD